MQDEKLVKLLLSAPRLLGMSVDRTLQPAVSVLSEIGVPTAMLAKLAMSSPSILCVKPAKYQAFCAALKQYGIGEQVRENHAIVKLWFGVLVHVSLSRHPMRHHCWKRE